MSQTVAESESTSTKHRGETLTLPRSGLRLEGNTLYRTGRENVVIAAHNLAEISKLKLVRRFDVPMFLFGVILAFLALAAKMGIDSSTAGWIVSIGAGVLACMLMAGALGPALELTASGVTATYRLVDQDADCEGFSLSTIERWKRSTQDGEAA